MITTRGGESQVLITQFDEYGRPGWREGEMKKGEKGGGRTWYQKREVSRHSTTPKRRAERKGANEREASDRIVRTLSIVL